MVSATAAAVPALSAAQTLDPRARTIERIADLEAHGWIIIRITRDILRYRSGVFLARVRDAMLTAGWPHCDQIRIDTQIWLDRVA